MRFISGQPCLVSGKIAAGVQGAAVQADPKTGAGIRLYGGVTFTEQAAQRRIGGGLQRVADGPAAFRQAEDLLPRQAADTAVRRGNQPFAQVGQRAGLRRKGKLAFGVKWSACHRNGAASGSCRMRNQPAPLSSKVCSGVRVLVGRS